MANKRATVRIVNSIISDTSVVDVDRGVVMASEGGAVWLQGTSVHGNHAVLPLVATDSDPDTAIYSDRPDSVFRLGAWSETGQPADATRFLSRDNKWFETVVAVRLFHCAMHALQSHHSLCSPLLLQAVSGANGGVGTISSNKYFFWLSL